jgi:hypothetical protein
MRRHHCFVHIVQEGVKRLVERADHSSRCSKHGVRNDSDIKNDPAGIIPVGGRMSLEYGDNA